MTAYAIVNKTPCELKFFFFFSQYFLANTLSLNLIRSNSCSRIIMIPFGSGTDHPSSDRIHRTDKTARKTSSVSNCGRLTINILFAISLGLHLLIQNLQIFLTCLELQRGWLQSMFVCSNRASILVEIPVEVTELAGVDFLVCYAKWCYRFRYWH